MALVFVAFLTLLCALSASAQEGVQVQVTGKNVNFVKQMCGDKNPELDAKLGSMNVLVVTQVLDADGNAVEGLAGKVLHYLPVVGASKLIVGEDNLDKDISVKGVLYKDALVIGVQEFEVQSSGAADAGDWDDWDELEIKTMSQQQVI